MEDKDELQRAHDEQQAEFDRREDLWNDPGMIAEEGEDERIERERRYIAYPRHSIYLPRGRGLGML